MEQEMNHQFGETHNKIITVDIESEMKRSFLDYSMSVIVSRALPDVRDGLKPVHRRILYTMYENGLSPEKAYRKCADTVGAVLGRYHPHGDASVYDALVRLAQDFSMRYPLVDGHGNFGSVDGDPPAAYRYTEAKMSRISTVMLTDIDKDTIDYGSNYDDRLKEPLVLPSRFPNILVNGSTGIAVGMATNIPPHNLGEVIDAVVMLLDKPDATLEDIMAYIPGPDFPTGGIIMGRSGIRAAYGTGRGKITLRGRAEIQEHKNGREKIVITEIPYMVNKARLIENIADLVKDKRITDISDIRDESDREGMRIVVELKRDANAQVVLNQLYNYTQLQDTVGVIMLALHDGRPQVMTLPQILRYYIDFQEEVLTRRTRYDLRKAKEREHILEGMKLVVDHTDEVIHIIRHSEDQNDAKKNLSERFGVTDEQKFRVGRQSSLSCSRQTEEDSCALTLFVGVGRAVHRSHAFQGVQVVHNREDTFFHLTAVPCIQDYLFVGFQVEYGSCFGVQAQFFVVFNFGFGSVERYEIGLAVVGQFFFGRTNEHIFYEVSLPSNFHDETYFQTGSGVSTAESIHHEQSFARKFFNGFGFQVGPSCFGARFVVVFIFIGSPPDSVLAGFIHNKEFIFGRTTGVDSSHYIHSAEFSYLTFFITFQSCFGFFLKQNFVRRIV